MEPFFISNLMSSKVTRFALPDDSLDDSLESWTNATSDTEGGDVAFERNRGEATAGVADGEAFTGVLIEPGAYAVR